MNRNQEIVTKLGLKKGSTIKILKMSSHPEMTNKTGVIYNITSDFQLEGTWGSMSIVPSVDKIEKVE